MIFRRPIRPWLLPVLLAVGACALPGPLSAQPVGHITGIGGVFVRARDPAALAAWYRDVLGIAVEPWGGAMLRYDAPGHPDQVVWQAFRRGTDYFDPSNREFMINFAVDDLDAFVSRITAKGVTVIKRDNSDPHGHFAWIVDPDGTKIELYQPIRN